MQMTLTDETDDRPGDGTPEGDPPVGDKSVEITPEPGPSEPGPSEPGPAPDPYVAAEWLAKLCSNISLMAGPAFAPLEQHRYRFLTAIGESATLGHFSRDPSADDLAALLRRGITAVGDGAARAAMEHWIQTIASEAAELIVSRKEILRQRAIADAERVRLRAERQRAEAARKEIMERSEWEKQDILAREAEAKKWAAFEAQRGEYEAWRARQSDGVEAG